MSDLPPYPYLMQVVQHYPLAAETYIELWRKKDKKHKVSVKKSEIKSNFLKSPTKFKNDLYALAKEALINVSEVMDIDQKEWWQLDIEVTSFDLDGEY